MTTKLNAFLIALVLFGATFFSCKTEKKEKNELVLYGEISNMKTGKIMINVNHQVAKVAIEVKDGKFEYKTAMNEPAELAIYTPKENEFGSSNYLSFWVSAGEVQVKLNGEEFDKDPVIIGSKIYDDSKKFNDEIDRIYPHDPFDLYKEMSPLYMKKDKESVAKLEALQEIAAVVREKRREAELKTEEWFIDNYPDSYYAAILVRNRNSGKRGGKNLNEVKAEVARLSDEMQKTPAIQRLLKHNSDVAKTDIDLAEFMKNTGDVNYKKDATFDGTQFKGIKYLASFNSGNICSLDDKGNVSIISPDGKLIRNIDIPGKGKVNAIAISPDDKVYIPSTIMGVEKAKFRGKMVERPVVKGIDCYVFNEGGKQLDKFELPQLKDIFGLKVTKENILISDYSQASLKVFDINTREVKSTIENLRPCCLMLDFDVNDKNQIFVANLAAFRTSIFDFDGNILATFGKRGKTINDFHGCCNPVNVASLPNGAVITVEKDPTRVKVYDKSGAKKIDGIEELVKGCAYIPMTVDRNENIYLASPEKGLVRCVAI